MVCEMFISAWVEMIWMIWLIEFVFSFWFTYFGSTELHIELHTYNLHRFSEHK